jgi:hypothetical protein
MYRTEGAVLFTPQPPEGGVGIGIGRGLKRPERFENKSS